MDQPTAAEPLLIECAECGGIGCPACQGRRRLEVIGCPKKMIAPQIWHLCRAAGYVEHGILPGPDSLWDQDAGVLAALDFWSGEKSKNESKMDGGGT